MLIWAGADMRLAFMMTRFSTSATRLRIAHLFLIADHVLEQRHLLHFLEAALADGAVGRLRRHQQQRRVVPVGGLHGGDEVGDARVPFWAIIMPPEPSWAHLAGRQRGEAVRHHAAGMLFSGRSPRR
jgi:hypothetical protein